MSIADTLSLRELQNSIEQPHTIANPNSQWLAQNGSEPNVPDNSPSSSGIVTGAGAGIGWATVAQLRRLGASDEAWDKDKHTRDTLPAEAQLRTHVVDVTDETTSEQIRKLHDLNIIGPTLVTQAFLPA